MCHSTARHVRYTPVGDGWCGMVHEACTGSARQCRSLLVVRDQPPDLMPLRKGAGRQLACAMQLTWILVTSHMPYCDVLELC